MKFNLLACLRSYCKDACISSGSAVPDGYSRAVRGGGGVHTSERDAELLLVTSRQLDDSEFYAAGGSVTAADARHRLRSSAAGTFVVRDSADPAHLYSLSVRTARRVTAIRIVYDQQRFRLDSDPQQVDSLMGLLRAIRARYNILRGVLCFRAIMNMSILLRCCRML